MGRTQDAFDALHDRRVTNKLMDILDDSTHPLRQEFDKQTDPAKWEGEGAEGQNHEIPELFCTPDYLPL